MTTTTNILTSYGNCTVPANMAMYYHAMDVADICGYVFVLVLWCVSRYSRASVIIRTLGFVFAIFGIGVHAYLDYAVDENFTSKFTIAFVILLGIVLTCILGWLLVSSCLCCLNCRSSPKHCCSGTLYAVRPDGSTISLEDHLPLVVETTPTGAFINGTPVPPGAQVYRQGLPVVPTKVTDSHLKIYHGS